MWCCIVLWLVVAHGAGAADEPSPRTLYGGILELPQVGTEEGTVHKCSKAYSSQYLSTYTAHSLAVYSVKWNPIHHRIFLSAGADW